MNFLYLLFTLVVSVTLYGCRSHVLDDGPFVLKTSEVLRDDCNVAGTLSWLESGALKTTGNLVRFSFADNKLALQGNYKTSPLLSAEAEKLVMNGSLTNDWVLLDGQQCLVDTLNLHVEVTTIDANNFTGKAAVTFQSLRAPTCNCKYWYLFTAERP